MLWLISPHPASCPKILGDRDVITVVQHGPSQAFPKARSASPERSRAVLAGWLHLNNSRGRCSLLRTGLGHPGGRVRVGGDASVSGDLLELGAPSGHAHRRAPQRSTQPYPLDLVVGPTASSFSATEAVLDFFDAS